MRVARRVPRAAIVVLAALLGVLAPHASAGDASAERPDLRWALTVFGGPSAGRSNLGDIVLTQWSIEVRGGGFVGAALSLELARFWRQFIFEGELGAGYRFEMPEAGESPEGWGALGLRFDGFPWRKLLYTTIAYGVGLNYAGRIPDAERRDDSPSVARLMLYLAPEVSVALPAYPQHELMFRVHHRSSGYGFMWDITVGSNVLTAGYRYRF